MKNQQGIVLAPVLIMIGVVVVTGVAAYFLIQAGGTDQTKNSNVNVAIVNQTNANVNTNSAVNTNQVANNNSSVNTNTTVNTNSVSNTNSTTNTNTAPSQPKGVQNGVYYNSKYKFSVKLNGMTASCGPSTCTGDDEQIGFYETERGATVEVAKLGGATSSEAWLKSAGLNHPDIALSGQTVDGVQGTSFLNTTNYQDYPGYVTDSARVSFVRTLPSGAQPQTLMSGSGSRGFAAIHNGYVIVVYYGGGLGRAVEPEVYRVYQNILANLTFID